MLAVSFVSYKMMMPDRSKLTYVGGLYPYLAGLWILPQLWCSCCPPRSVQGLDCHYWIWVGFSQFLTEKMRPFWRILDQFSRTISKASLSAGVCLPKQRLRQCPKQCKHYYWINKKICLSGVTYLSLYAKDRHMTGQLQCKANEKGLQLKSEIQTQLLYHCTCVWEGEKPNMIFKDLSCHSPTL